MVDDVKNITETAESKATADAIDRARLARERREAEQRKRLDELRAHAAAAQAQREKRDDDRRRRQAEQRAKDDDRRVQVEERKRAIWEASISRREALLQRERDRTERLERARAARSAPRPAFAFGSSTPRLLEPLDSAGFFWAARRAASTTNVMFASAPLTRRASALQLDSSDADNKDEPDRQPQAVMWSSVARRRTDLVPTVPAPRAPGRAYSMTRLDRIPSRPLTSASPSMLHLNRTQCRSGDTTPGSRPGSAMSQAGVVRRAGSAQRKPRPASIAGTGVNTPRGGIGDTCAASVATTPSMSRDSSMVGGEAPRRPATTPRRPRPASLHAGNKTPLPVAPGEGKPPLHRKPKPSKEHENKTPRGKSVSASPGRTLSPSPAASKEPSVDKEIANKNAESNGIVGDKRQVSAHEVTQKLEALQIQNGDAHNTHLDDKVNENKEILEIKQVSKPEPFEAPAVLPSKPAVPEKPIELQKHVEKKQEVKEDVRHKKQEVNEVKEKLEAREEFKEKKENSLEKADDSEMTASMSARRITTEEEAKAALAERRRRAREELERQAELERQRLQREAEEEVERQRLEEERQRREEEEARELAALQRRNEEEKLRKAIEAQQQLEREESERRLREEAAVVARAREEEDKRRAAEEAERLRRGEAEREERERLARKQRVEAIMARTRLKKAEEEKKQQENRVTAAPSDNGNAVATADLLGMPTSQVEESKQPSAPEPEPLLPPPPGNNGNAAAPPPPGLSRPHNSEDTSQNQSAIPHVDNAGTNNGNHADLSASFLQSERLAEQQSKIDSQSARIADQQGKLDSQPAAGKLLDLDDDFTAHNGHGTHPLTLQNAI